MAGLIGGLINGAKALGAHQAGVQTAGRNLANVNNPEYARQRVLLGDRAVVNGIGTGVEALGVKQIRDGFLDTAVTREISQTAYLAAQQSALERAEANLGEQIDRTADSGSIGDANGSTTGISAALNDFFNAFDALATSPGDSGQKQLLLQKATILADKFNVTDSRLSALQSDLDAEINAGVATANSLLKQIADLNAAIAHVEIGAPESALALRDQRQARLEDLGKLMNFTAPTIPGSHGQLQIVVKDSAGAEVVLVDKAQVFGSVSFDGTGFTGGAAGAALGLQSGSLKGQLDVRDGAIQGLRDDLKRTADQLAGAVNTAYAGNFFQTAPATGPLALDSSVTLGTLRTSATGDAGANELALAVADLANRRFSVASGDTIDGTIGSFFAQTVSNLGQSLAGVTTKLGDQELVESMLTQQRDSVSAVSMDEEMADLMKFQRAYQASARVISVLDEMLDGLVNGMIR